MFRKKCFLVSMIVSLILFTSTTVYGVFDMSKKIYNNSLSAAKIVLKPSSLYAWENDAYTLIESGFEGYNNGVLSCYATKRSPKDTHNYIQLNQVGVTVKFASNVNVRLRVKIQDEWISQKYYNTGTVKIATITKDWKESGSYVNPFTFASEGSTELWDYDVTTGYAYYQNIIPGDPTGENITKEFLVHNHYEYETSNTVTGYSETIFVTLNFQVDLVQANRAEKVWGVTF